MILHTGGGGIHRACSSWDGARREFRMLQGLTDHRYVFPRIQEYIVATKKGKPKKAQKYGRLKENKGKPSRYLK